MIWETLPAYLVRIAGFSFSRLAPLRCSRSSTAAAEVEMAATTRRSAGLAFDDVVSRERFADLPALDDPDRRKQFSRAIKRARGFARELTPTSIPDAELREIAQAIPRVAPYSEALRDTHETWQAAQATFRSTFGAEFERTRDALKELYRDPRLREAVLLESFEAYERIEQLLATEGPRNARARQRERLAVMYAQRFCAKNDTNSFCGPHGAAYVDDVVDASAKLAIEREDLRRETYFSHWAAQLLLDEAIRRAPTQATLRRHPSVHVDGRSVSWFRVIDDTATAMRRQYARTELAPEGIQLLSALERPRRLYELTEVAGSLGIALDDVRGFLDELTDAGILVRGPRIRSGAFRPLDEVAREVEEWEASEARTWALAEVQACDALLARFARGNLATRATVLRELSDRFTEATGRPATRASGDHYADRGLLHEDASVEVSVVLGAVRRTLETTIPIVMAALELPIELARTRTREWLAARFGSEVWVPAIEVHRAFDDDRVLETAPSGARAVALRAAMQRVRDLIDARTRSGDTVIASSDLQVAVTDAPAATHPGYVSVDLMLCERANRTDVVLGEVHGFLWLPTCLLDVLPAGDRERIVAHMREALAQMAGDTRTAECVFPHRLATDRRIPVATLDLELMVRGDRADAIELGELSIRLVGERVEFAHRDRAVIPLAPYTNYPFIQYTSQIAPLFDDLAERYFPNSLLPERFHQGDTPRIVVDDVAIQRRTWRRSAGAIRAALASKTEAELFARARALRAELGCEVHVFVSITGEPKPILVDFENVFLLEALANLVERRPDDAIVKVSEMLPGPDELLARGPDGRRTAELRMGFYRR